MRRLRTGWLCIIFIMLFAFPQGRHVEAGEAPIYEPVVYAEIPEDLIFRYAPGESLQFLRLIVEIPWNGSQRECWPSLVNGYYEARWNVSGIPLMTEIRYHWEARTNPYGAPWRTDWQSVSRPDPVSRAREWRVLSGQHVDVFYPWKEPGIAQQIAVAADVGYESATEILGEAAYEGRPRVVLLANSVDYWMLSPVFDSAGIAFPSHGVTLQYVAGNKGLEETTIPHELLHVLDPTAERLDVPIWFSEGLAVANEQHDHAHEESLLRNARRTRALYTYPSMLVRCWDCDQDLWYAQAWDMVRGLKPEQLQTLLAEIPTQGFPPAFKQIVGKGHLAWGAQYTRCRLMRWDLYAAGALVLLLVILWWRRR